MCKTWSLVVLCNGKLKKGGGGGKKNRFKIRKPMGLLDAVDRPCNMVLDIVGDYL